MRVQNGVFSERWLARIAYCLGDDDDDDDGFICHSVQFDIATSKDAWHYFFANALAIHFVYR